MGALPIRLLALFATVVAARAEVVINFDNRFPGDPGKLVRMVHFVDSSGNYQEIPVVNGLAEGEAFVAQLFAMQGGMEVAVGDPANFRVSTSTSPGTWVGAVRTIPWATPGEPVLLRVKAWDARAGSFESAGKCNLLSGSSERFTFTPPVEVTSSDQIRMTGFKGFTLTRAHYPPFATFEVTENAEVALPAAEILPMDGVGSASLDEWRRLLEGADWSAGGRVAVRGDQAVIQVPPYRYGEWRVVGTDCDECGHCTPAPLLKVQVLPDPRRPYLALVRTGSGYDLVLRGVAGQFYRVERSINLRNWMADREETFVGNPTEVLIRRDVVGGDAQWFRLVPK